MASQTDTAENKYITGMLTIVPDSEYPGNIEVAGNVYVNNIDENTFGSGVRVSGIGIKDNTVTLTEVATPAVPALPTKQTLYLDSSDGLLKSIKNSGSITTYQPLTTKGDILVHDGTTQTRLPLGTSGQRLRINTASSQGVEWKSNSSFDNPADSVKQTLLQGTSVYALLSNNSHGAFFFCVTPYIEGGASGTVIVSKANVSIAANVAIINSNSSLTNSGLFTGRWQNYRGVELSKGYSEADGMYTFASNVYFERNFVTLSSTTSVLLDTQFFGIRGAYFISVSPKFSGGPAVNVILVKSIASLGSSNIFIIGSSPGTSDNKLGISWGSGLYPSVFKSNANNDGEYMIKDTFQDTTFSVDITLSGVSVAQVPYQVYDKGTFIVRVTSNVSDSPCAIFTVSKNSYTRNANITSHHSPGLLGTKLALTWNASSILSISKDDSNYNGVYTLDFTFL